MSISKITDWSDIPQIHSQGKSIVFTNGCFDIIHAGHVLYLEQARALGDILIVGLNSDSSVKRLKGEGRPVNIQQNRALVLAALEAVSYVIIFNEDTPYELIKAIQPDVLVKGGDWKEDSIVGADIVRNKGGKVISLPFWEGLSSTSIIEKAGLV
jgi:rfaE bifunctional protein nucleotidyltransferase chain/domain